MERLVDRKQTSELRVLCAGWLSGENYEDCFHCVYWDRPLTLFLRWPRPQRHHNLGYICKKGVTVELTSLHTPCKKLVKNDFVA